MFPRNYLRRGVSLEVIVEEDDNAEVSFDPTMLDDDLVSESSSSYRYLANSPDCVKNSPKEEEGKTDKWERLRKEKERRRRLKEEGEERWRRLDKQRSLSCETLTVLDVGDDPLSKEQWEEEANEWHSRTENTPDADDIPNCISRKMILASRADDQLNSFKGETQEKINKRNYSDLEDCRYCDPCAVHEMESNVDSDCSNENIEDVEGINGVNVDNNEIPQCCTEELEVPAELEPVKADLQDTNGTDNEKRFAGVRIQDTLSLGEDSWIRVGELENIQDDESDYIQENETEIHNTPNSTAKELTHTTDENSETQSKENSLRNLTKIAENVHYDPLLSAENGKKQFDKLSTNTKESIAVIAEKLARVLSPPNITIIEKIPKNIETHTSNNRDTKGMCNGECNKNDGDKIIYKGVPPPTTVASIRDAFEKLPPVPVNHYGPFQFSYIFDHVRSNPSSKIIRFDRERHDQDSTSSVTSFSSRTSSTASANSTWCGRFIKTTFQEDFDDDQSVTDQRSVYSSSTCSDTYSSTGVPLRKPKVAKGFNIQKALEEKPSYFHIRVSNKFQDKTSNRSGSNGNNIKIKRTRPTEFDSITYSYVEAKRNQNNRGAITTLRWAREVVDRSDAESVSSESSEDSGVNRDFTSSIISSFASTLKKEVKMTKARGRCLELLKGEYRSDPSIKWIEPSVLAKIRSMGTTVIYFGPRHHPLTPKREQELIRAKQSTKLKQIDEMNEDNKSLGEDSAGTTGSAAERYFTAKDQVEKSVQQTESNTVIYDFTKRHQSPFEEGR